MRQSDRRAVVFVDDSPLWHSFQQVAALVRRHGYQTVRVTTARTGRVARLVDRLLYNHAIYLSDAAELARLPELLRQFRPAKLCVTDTLLDAIDDGVVDRLPADIAASLRVQRRLSDKTNAGALAVERGALVPDQLPGSVPAAEAVERLGLPIVVKANYGAAGSGVRIAHTAAEAEQAAATMGAVDDFFYQRFVAGPILSYGAMVADEGIVQEMTYRGIDSSSNPTGAPLGYEVIDDPAFAEIGRSVCLGVGTTGPINLQAIRDSEGLYWVIDLNIRPFGGMLNYDQNRIDTAAGYLYSTQLTDDRPIHRTPPPGLRISEFPIDAEELARTGRYWSALNVYLRRSPSFVRLLRVNYLAFAVLNGVAHKLHV
jgi:Carbamoyl-phosphate synthase L chain, ATP binding domain